MAAGNGRRAPTYNELMREFGGKRDLALGFERLGDSIIVRAEKIPGEPKLDAVEFAKKPKPIPQYVQPEIAELSRRITSLEDTIAELRIEMNGKRKEAEKPGGAAMPPIPLVVSRIHNFLKGRQERADTARFREFQRKLFILSYDGPQPLAKICEFTGANPEAAAVYLSRMQAQGLVVERKSRTGRAFGIRR